MGEIRITSTPYDDVFRTLLNDCSGLIIPVINEVFGETYSGEEEIVFSVNEHFLNQQGGMKKSGLQIPVLRYLEKKQRSIIWNVRAVQIIVCW